MGYITHLKKVSINEHVCANYDFTIILINRKKSFYPLKSECFLICKNLVHFTQGRFVASLVETGTNGSAE